MKFSACMLISRDGPQLEVAIDSLRRVEPDEIRAYIDPMKLPDQSKAQTILKAAGAKIFEQEISGAEDHHDDVVHSVHRAILEAENPVILWLDDDDELIEDPRPYLNLVTPDVGLIKGGVQRIFPDGNTSVKFTKRIHMNKDITGIVGSFGLYNQEAFRDIHPHVDHGYFWDYKIAYWLRRAGYKVLDIPQIMSIQNVNPDPGEIRKSYWGKFHKIVEELELRDPDYRRRLRVLIPAWNLNEFRFNLFEPRWKALAKHVELEIVYYLAPETKFEPEANWATFTEADEAKFNYNNLSHVLKYTTGILQKVNPFDVLLIRSGWPQEELMNVAISKLARKPVVMMLDGNGSLVRRLISKTPIDALNQDALDEIVLSSIDAISPISSSVAKAVRPKLSNPSKMKKPIPLGVDTDIFNPSPPPEEKIIGYCGRLSVEKGTDFLSSIMKATPDLNYKVLGPIQVEHFDFPPNCHYQGFCVYSETPSFYKEVSVVILPSLTEGLPSSVLESYSSSRPVILTPESHPDELPIYGWEVPRDVTQWENVLRGITLEEANAKGLEARRYITENWPTWDDYARMMNGLLMETVQAKKNPP
jgi:glycosyltransferase involved in cell wall biosynthesis